MVPEMREQQGTAAEQARKSGERTFERIPLNVSSSASRFDTSQASRITSPACPSTATRRYVPLHSASPAARVSRNILAAVKEWQRRTYVPMTAERG